MMQGTACQNEAIIENVQGEEFSLTLDMGEGSRTAMGQMAQYGEKVKKYMW